MIEIPVTYCVGEYTYERLKCLASRWNTLCSTKKTPEEMLSEIMLVGSLFDIDTRLAEMEQRIELMKQLSIKKSADCAGTQTTQSKKKHSTYNIPGGRENVKTL